MSNQPQNVAGYLYQALYYLMYRKRILKRMRMAIKENPDFHRSKGKASHARVRNRVLDWYGGQCVCCHEKNRRFLSFDHVNGGGNRLRKSKAHGDIVPFLHRYGEPIKDFQILCHNCNLARAFYKKCCDKLKTSKE